VTQSVFTAKYARFRKLLVAARKDAGLTQEQVANKLGWEQTNISKAERGVRRLDLIEFLAFAKAIGVDVGGFIRELEQK
jgi:transcriptional regulator with XRE-family HTH domain